MENTAKKKMIIFIAIAYGISYLMGILMYIGVKQNLDRSVFPVAQMMYPASGVIIGKLIYDSKEKALPKLAFILTLICNAIIFVLSIMSIAAPQADLEVSGQTIGFYYMISNYVLIVFSFVVYILFWACGKEKRENIGIERKNIKLSIAMIALFILLYMIRIALAYIIDGIIAGDGFSELTEWLTIFTDSYTWLNIVALPINFFVVFLAFFGEEYGWRYYLQPILQNKFGKRWGVLVLGIVWGLWHLPDDFFYYTTTTGPQMFVSQLITCVSLGIFFAYAYMKTGNIWVPVIFHYLNNNLIPIISGVYTSDVLENQSVNWSDLPFALLVDVVFILFICSKEFNANEPIKQTKEEQTELG